MTKILQLQVVPDARQDEDDKWKKDGGGEGISSDND